jgi:hypothetical protein
MLGDLKSKVMNTSVWDFPEEVWKFLWKRFKFSSDSVPCIVNSLAHWHDNRRGQVTSVIVINRTTSWILYHYNYKIPLISVLLSFVSLRDCYSSDYELLFLIPSFFVFVICHSPAVACVCWPVLNQINRVKYFSSSLAEREMDCKDKIHFNFTLSMYLSIFHYSRTPQYEDYLLGSAEYTCC